MHVLGLDAKMYIRTSGTYESPTWSEYTNCRDVTLELTSDTTDASTRGSQGWRITVPTLKNASVNFTAVWDTDDELFTAIQEAYFNNLTVDIAVLDGDITMNGSEGLRADMAISSFSRNESLEEVLTVDVVMTPTYSSVAPVWMTVTDGTTTTTSSPSS